MTEDDFSDLDILMSQDPLSLSDQEIERIIAYQRKMRVQREAGVRTRKPREAAPSKLDISALLASPAKPSNFKRRV
jgi:hypothetical protein